MSEPLSSSSRLRAGSPAAAAIAWPWRSQDAAAAAVAAVLARRRLRCEGLIRALVGGAMGTLFFGLGAFRLAFVAWGLAGVVLLAALLSPSGMYAAIGRALALLGLGIGRALAILLLTSVFFLFFLPFGRLLRSGRRDRLERFKDRTLPTYWHRRDDRPRTKASFEKAF